VPADATVVDMAGIQQPDGARRPTSVGDASSEADPWSQYPSGSPALLMPSSRRVRWAVTAGLDVAYSIATYTERLLRRSPRCRESAAFQFVQSQYRHCKRSFARPRVGKAAA